MVLEKAIQLRMDLTKACGCIPHDVLIAKIAAYEFDKAALNLIRDYLSNRYQRVKIGSTFASILDIYKGVPEGFIIGPILFSVFLNELMCFIKLTEVRNFADNIKLYSCSAINNDANQKPTNHIHFVLNCFRVNSTVANPGISDKLIILLASS